jgi:hypothetical protein
MKSLTRISIAVACALGVSAALAQSVQRDGVTVSKAGATQTVAQAPIQTAQAGAAAGGAAGGASSAGALGGVGVAGSAASTITFVGAAAVSVAGTKSTTSH